jgi:16S rRNA (uracil1498-N3)-methyltransferase
VVEYGWAAAHDAVAHFFVDRLDDECTIDGPDGHHLQRVRRLREGEHVTAADGTGAWRAYVVSRSAPGRLDLAATAAARREPELTPRVNVAVALTKGGLDDVVAACTELGVHRIEPVRTARSVVRWDAARAAKAVARLRDVAREAAMQSRRARVPEVCDVADAAALVDRPGLVLAARDGAPVASLPRPDGGEWTVLVGPEGGFAPAELALFARAARASVGPYVVRAAHAPLAVVSAFAQRTTPVPDVVN